ncbi:UPF0187-domain-containing protein [Marasmius fiardii PR-910]|nr:UPF0187-domain-containing protein [Marasmius fiardii PR-910]
MMEKSAQELAGGAIWLPRITCASIIPKSAEQVLERKLSQKVGIKKATTFSHESYKGFGNVSDPFAPRQRPGDSLFQAILATALFRCWHILIFFGAWATVITILNDNGHELIIQPTVLTVTGTVVGFVISYRTTSSFERYNEGRRLWSQIILATRTFARTVWFHVPEPTETQTGSVEQLKARALLEKKTVVNLLEAFSVAVKHYLRGEDGIYYEDLYYLVKFLPAYALPPGIPIDPLTGHLAGHSKEGHRGQPSEPSGDSQRTSSFLHRRLNGDEKRVDSQAEDLLPLPATASKLKSERRTSFFNPLAAFDRKPSTESAKTERDKVILSRADEIYLLPSSNPPKYHFFDIFPLSLLARLLTHRGKSLKGKKAARLRVKMRNKAISHNLPLEITLYLSSYIAALQLRKTSDVPTINTLLNSLNQLVDSLTGLERILTTPIPFSYVSIYLYHRGYPFFLTVFSNVRLTRRYLSFPFRYSIHLWVVTLIYCLALPPQIWSTLKWLTIPATVILTFIFFGFLVAGEEIENPFGYDKNDLNLDHFTHNIIRNELQAITSTPPPIPAKWAFVPENDLVFAKDPLVGQRLTPQEWMEKGYYQMQAAGCQ